MFAVTSYERRVTPVGGRPGVIVSPSPSAASFPSMAPPASDSVRWVRRSGVPVARRKTTGAGGAAAVPCPAAVTRSSISTWTTFAPSDRGWSLTRRYGSVGAGGTTGAATGGGGAAGQTGAGGGAPAHAARRIENGDRMSVRRARAGAGERASKRTSW